jgi:hypothetical protein
MSNAVSITTLPSVARSRVQPTLLADEATRLASLLAQARVHEQRWLFSERTDLTAHAAWQRAQLAMNALAELVLWRVLDVQLPARLRVMRDNGFVRLTALEVHVEPLDHESDALAWYVAGLEHDEWGRPTRTVCRARVDDAFVWTDEHPAPAASAEAVPELALCA